MKKIYLIPLFILVGIILFIFCFIYWFKNETSPFSQDTHKTAFVVEKGKTASEVGTLLFQNKLIKNKLAFKIYVQFFDKSQNINAGEFELSPSMSVSEIVDTLGRGAKELWVTIPEGLRKEEIAERIVKGLELDEAKSNTFKSEFLSLSKSSEGYLFPDTYLFPRESTAKFVFDRLTQTFNQKFEKDVLPLLDKKYSKSDVVIMASILERETKGDEEKPVVAGILWKRIESDWPLQVDATVQYGLSNSKLSAKIISVDEWWPVLTLDDLDINSPYNTYKFKGLPPAPISNSGLKSLQAAAKSTPSEYWFYIHDSDGVIHYAKTSQEHAANVRNYLGKQ